ncbi:gamma-tubulin complex DGRIP91/SPC98 component [Fomitopsis serialis]|uniref:gamma-tubulin complex DGRIP91/SPC98 component n=1 Tax=Fomitopsis serialis TaxID=139415 RepID=UPI002008C7E5|nr:gamma-tubulin complex DGRIP91/SPC98 component [Neoantrodia serialis]KAH9938282.1 gamma-tubulin complex DGRIP91/SPC98 component [Neoantrodia serialis]
MSSSLESLVTSLVPRARQDANLRKELISHCQEILSSHIGQSVDSDIGHLADLVKRSLLQSTPDGTTALRFTNLLSRLLDQQILSRKHASLQFLHALSLSPKVSSISPAFLPSLAPPPPLSRTSTATLTPVDPTPPAKLPKGKSKAELLREYRNKIGRPHLPEHLILRDTLYLLQGISGKYVHFSASTDPNGNNELMFTDDPSFVISRPTKALVHRLAEVGHLYMRVDAFVREREGKVGVGMIEQSLCHHLQTQLTEYYRLIAVLESQMASHPSEDDPPGQGSANAREETGLTLKRLDVWIEDWKLRMRMMSVCVEGAKGAHGGALVNLIHGYADNGDPFIRKFTDQLLDEVSKPFFATLHKWLFSGELVDPFSEFFVAVDPELAHLQYGQPSHDGVGPSGGDGGFGGLGDGEDLSGEREGEDMLPAFVGEVFGRKILSTGKSLNFIRYTCHDSDWVATQEKISNTGGTLQYSDIAGLERSIDAAYQIASQRLFEVFFEIRHPSSNAQNDPPDVLRRLDARMLEYSHGEIGWDVFTLEYKVDAPIDTVLDPDAIVKYLKLFNHIWKIKRIESTLTKGWMRIAGGARTFLQVPELNFDWHQIRIVMAEMIHFIRQMESYCQLEVVECSWKILLEFIQKREGDLDTLIEAHGEYLDRMVKKVLLLNPKAGREENLLNQVRDVFAIILQFREATDDFYNYGLSEAARRDSERDAARGVVTTIPSSTSKHHDPEVVHDILTRVKEYSTAFSDRVQTIVQALSVHADLDCRFLAIRLSFSDFYKGRKEPQKS